MSTPHARHPGAALLLRMRRSPVLAWMLDYSRFHVFELPDLGFAPLPPGFAAQDIDEDHLRDVAHCREMADPDRGVRHLATRYRLGCVCVGLRRTDHLAGYAWASLGSNVLEDHDRYLMSLGPNGAYLFDTFLHPDDRGQGLYESLLRCLQVRLRGLGASRYFLTVDTFNTRSLNAHARLGARWIETVTYWRRFGIDTHRAMTPTSRYGAVDLPWRRHGFPSRLLNRATLESMPAP